MSDEERALRVLIVDGYPVVREGFRSMLNGEGDIQVVGEASNGEEALEMAFRLEPNVVLTGIKVSGMSGLEITQRITAERPDIAVIVLTMYDNETYVVETLRAGATGYIVKGSPREFLRHGIRAAAQGGTAIRRDPLYQAIQGLVRTPREGENGHLTPGVTERFTARELDVLRLVAQGCANKEIAQELHLAEVTVKKYVQRIMGKLGVSDRVRAAIAAVRLGLV